MGNRIDFGKVRRLALFGGSWIMAALLPDLERRPLEVKLFTSPRHLADVVNDAGDTLE